MRCFVFWTRKWTLETMQRIYTYSIKEWNKVGGCFKFYVRVTVSYLFPYALLSPESNYSHPNCVHCVLFCWLLCLPHPQIILMIIVLFVLKYKSIANGLCNTIFYTFFIKYFAVVRVNCYAFHQIMSSLYLSSFFKLQNKKMM